MTHLARNTDSAESHQAADEITQDGTLDRMAEIAYAILKANPGKTANELEQIAGYRDGQLRKRLSGLLKEGRATKGESRVSAVTGKRNATWNPVVNELAVVGG